MTIAQIVKMSVTSPISTLANNSNGSQVLQVNTFARIESAFTFRDGLSFLIKSISLLIRQSNLLEPLVSTWNYCFERKSSSEVETSSFFIANIYRKKVVHPSYVRKDNVYKLTTIPVCVHQRVREGGRKYNQHILHCTGYIETDKLNSVG